MASAEEIADGLIKEAIDSLLSGVEKIEHCLAQLNDHQIWWRPHEEMNAIGNLLLHLAGNLEQWIVAGIGNLEDTRDRPREFAQRDGIAKEALLSGLVRTVDSACATLKKQAPEDLLRVKKVQEWQVTKMHALMNSVTHFQGHVQEIIGLTRQQLGGDYRFQWTPSDPEE